MKTRTRNLLAKLVLGAIAFFGASSDSFANHAWGPYHWGRRTGPLYLQLGNNLSANWSGVLTFIVADWNDPTKASANNGASAQTIQPWTKAPVIQTVLVNGAAGANCTPVPGTTQVCNNTYGGNGWLGLATVWMDGSGHIAQGTAKMNDTYFNLSTYNNANQRRHVVCQEVAHSFGLGHQSTNGSSQNSCMDYFSNTGRNATSTKSTRPNYHDFQQLDAIYGRHLDSTNTAATATATQPIAYRPTVTADPKTWGRLAHQSANGRHSEYVRNEADGTIAVTEVIWTDETAAICPSCDHRSHGPGKVGP